MAPVETIRSARVEDKEALESLQMRASLMWEEDRVQLLAHPEVVAIPLKQLERGMVLVAESAGTVVGFAALAERSDGETELVGLFVEPELWGQGIASQLMVEAEALALSRGSKQMHVIANPRAEGFYHRRGYIGVGQTNSTWRPAPLMCKQLKP